MRTKLDVKWHGLLDCEIKPMDDKTSMYFLNLSMMEKQGIPDGMEAEIEEKSLAYKIMKSRLQVVGSDGEISFAVKCFVTTMCDTPGLAVMWAYTLHYMRVVQKRKIDMWELALCFPMGFPTKEETHKAWDGQKYAVLEPEKCKDRPMGSPDNWIDDFANWPKLEEKSDGEQAKDGNGGAAAQGPGVDDGKTGGGDRGGQQDS